MPWAPRTDPEPTATGLTTTWSGPRCTIPAQTPTTSAIASRAPTSWKCTSIGSLPCTAASATASRSKTRSARSRTGSASGASRSRARTSRQVRWSDRVGRTSTWHRVAAKPPRDDGLHAQGDRLGADRVDRVLQDVERHAGTEQRAEEHVAARARRRVDPQRSVMRRGAVWRATRAANTPAPYPLSMLTTVTPGAQELSIASSAAIPPKEAP